FTWSSKDGYSLIRHILHNTPLLYEPHDNQLEGVCKSLDGIYLVAITPTGSGKTGYYTIYMLVMLAVIANPTLCPSALFPSNPCLLVICPTIPLQLEMHTNMNQQAPVHEHDTSRSGCPRYQLPDSFRCLAAQELWVVMRKKPNIILTGPEQLKSAEFEKVLRDKEFYARSCVMGFDKFHLLNTWGASFRK
ncbi:hypothetical protein DFH08DRAFT_624928, partial [Mycena albidolilacea]